MRTRSTAGRRGGGEDRRDHRRPALPEDRADRRDPPRGRRPAAGAGHPAQQGRSASARTTPTTPRRWAARRPSEPLMFLKPNTAVVGPGDPIVMPAADVRGRTTRASSRSSSAGSCKDLEPAAAHEGRLRLHLRQRRHRARPAARRRAVGAGQGLRHVLPARPVDRDRPRPQRALAGRTRRRRRGRPGRPHRRHGPRRRRPSSPTSSRRSRCCPATSSSPARRRASAPSRPASGSRSRSRASARSSNPFVRR